MAETRVLTLADVSFVEANFSYWSGEAGDRERVWFQRAWHAIIKAGLVVNHRNFDRLAPLTFKRLAYAPSQATVPHQRPMDRVA